MAPLPGPEDSDLVAAKKMDAHRASKLQRHSEMLEMVKHNITEKAKKAGVLEDLKMPKSNLMREYARQCIDADLVTHGLEVIN